MEKSENNDEIDLGQLLLRIVKLGSKYRILILVSVLVGAIAGYLYYSLTPPVYSSSMMLQSDILTEAYSETLTENLKKLIDEKNHNALADKLSIKQEQAAQLVDIKVESIEGSSGAEGAVENFIFLISVEIRDNSVLLDLQDGIISFLENNEFVKKRIDLKKVRFKALIDQMNSEGVELDSLKDLINSKLTKGDRNNLVLLDPSNVYEQAIKTYKEELVYQERLALIESIQLIEGFTAFSRPLKPRLILSTASGFFIGLLLSFMFIFLREAKIYLKSIDHPHN